jgi:NAD(P)-dependent dehydrogenase (short-subunit alcohol dehydrogenase family)
MSSGDGGAMLNISSIEAVRPTADSLPYAAANAGLNTLTKGTAPALGPRVRVNAVQCGPFLTDISAAPGSRPIGKRRTPH